MDVHSSSLLSPNAPAPDQLAEEHSALSHVYSDVRSNAHESSPQPLRSPHESSQDATIEPTVESTLIAQIVDNLKNLGDFDFVGSKLPVKIAEIIPDFSLKMVNFGQQLCTKKMNN